MADFFRTCFGKKRHVSVADCFSGLGIRDIVGYDPQPGEVVWLGLENGSGTNSAQHPPGHLAFGS